MITVALLHNRYRQPGGEDISTQTEHTLLVQAGHRVVECRRHNDEIGNGMWGRVAAGVKTTWAWDSNREIKALLKREKPDVAHFHNTFPLISPSAYYACREAGVPVVQTLHNYRLLCPAATFRQNGRICEKCVTGGLFNGVLHGCYRESRAATAATALMLGAHRWLGTWNELVDCYIALTEFSRRKFIEGGLPAAKIVIKPNFVSPDTGPREEEGEYALYGGRLSDEKGVRTMLRAWQKTNIPLRVAGDGPLRQELAAGQGLSNVKFHGHMLPHELTAIFKRARFLVFPSEWYEGMPRVILEAFASGLPVIASRLGAMQEIVEDGRTGLHFTAGDADDLAAKVGWAWTHPEDMQVMGRAARAEYEAKYTAERNYDSLMGIYQKAMRQVA